MYRWSKIPKKCRPKIISDIFDDKFYILKVQDWKFKKIKRKDVPTTGASSTASASAIYTAAVNVAWEGSYWQKGIFKNIIDKNIPCTLMHKVKNDWCSEIDTVVCFMTGDTLDVFLIHPDDLTEWDPNEEI